MIVPYAHNEQAVLARVRHSRLTDLFLGIATLPLEDNTRTAMEAGQTGLRELYVSNVRNDPPVVIPVQTTSRQNQLTVAPRTRRDIAYCQEAFPGLRCRPVSVQPMDDDVIAIFELTIQDGQILIMEEKHYKLVRSSPVTFEDLQSYCAS